ncbi:hypothetical protein F2Q68_00016153 [Brassica cretica]|uniref:Uncharacterized protein n=1 Tax=Brassica cretica TaxID=69181 RepID=A0A8S9HJ71_BRACR|nr:hypothetical protein F2Q68_00016153 [Brassica cretica]
MIHGSLILLEDICGFLTGMRVLPVGTLSSSIGSSPSSEGVLTVSGGFSEGLGVGLCALRRATSIFGICTRKILHVNRWRYQLVERFLRYQDWADVGVLLRIPRESESSWHCKMRLNPLVSSVDALEILSIDLDWPTSIDVRSLASIETNAIRRNSSNFLLRNLLLAASLPSPLAKNHPQ